MNNLPKPAVIGITILIALIALVIIFRTVKGGGENSAYGSKEEIMRQQAVGKGQADQARPTSTPATSNH